MRAAAPPGMEMTGFNFLRDVAVSVGDEPALMAGGLVADPRPFALSTVLEPLAQEFAVLAAARGLMTTASPAAMASSAQAAGLRAGGVRALCMADVRSG